MTPCLIEIRAVRAVVQESSSLTQRIRPSTAKGLTRYFTSWSLRKSRIFGSAEKPVGMVCFAWAIKGGVVSAVTHRFNGDRERVRRQSVIAALQGMLELLER